jgi:membrane protease YdiL (CAAX protease family)
MQDIQDNAIEQYPFAHAKGIFSKIGFAIFAMIVIINALTVVYSIFCMLFFPDLLKSHILMTIVIMFIQNIIGFFIAALIIGKGEGVPKQDEPAKISFKTLLMLFCACYFLMYVGAQIGNTVSFAISGFLGYDITSTALSLADELPVWCSLLLLVILAPITEELLFRKVIIDKTAIFGDKTAIFISALIFALFHGNFYQFFYAFLVGMLFAYVYIRSGKITISIILHMILNFFGGVLQPLVLEKLQRVMEFMDNFTSNSEGVDNYIELILQDPGIIIEFAILELYSVGLIAIVICGLIYLIQNAKRLLLRKGELQIPKGSGISVAFGNPGMFFFFFVCVCIFVVQMLPPGVL